MLIRTLFSCLILFATFTVSAQPSPRIEYGRAQVEKAMQAVNKTTAVRFERGERAKIPPEGFVLSSQSDGSIVITSSDDSGALYGALELARRIEETKSIPTDLSFYDAPAFKLRGPCIGMQKTYILPGRKVYEYPYTPELFPFFYDKEFWHEYLDFLAANRMNTLYLWNGHPFASLVRLEDYPYALEVDEATFARNVEMFRWIATEADRRGIWVVQQFYSIILSKPFAEKNGLETQLKAPTPVVNDYMRKSIAEFVKQYPNVGLMPCMGEALQGIDNQRFWLCEVILPGVKDGMKAAGLTEEPPVVLRTHATDLREYMRDALKVYRNLYTEAKFNGESLTTWEPRGVRQQVHLDMSQLGSTHLINVHILANLEPFRYGAQRFIQKSVIAGRDRLGARGVHLYPLFYWNWPDSPDVVSPPLKQWDRDWIWFEAWARYSWNPDIDEKSDRAYWIGRLAEMYGTPDAAERILDAYNDSGECAPRILRRYGITEGNRQTMSLGMTLDQLVNPGRYRPFEELWESQSPPGERLQEYVDREWNKQPHEGETPPQINKEILEFSKKACEAIDAAEPHVTKNKEEFARLKNDVYCIRAMSQFYAAKAEAAICVLRYQKSHDAADMEKALAHLEESLDRYRALVRLTKDAYHFANSMQTAQRRIPVPGGENGQPANYHWSQLLPIYEQELADFRQQVEQARSGASPFAPPDETSVQPLPKQTITLLSPNAETYEVKAGERVYTDRGYVIKSIAPELVGLTGIRFSHDQAKAGNYVPIEFEAAEPVKILVGYFQAKRDIWLQPPDLETDAQAVERGDSESILLNAATIEELPAVNIHALKFPAGKNKLDLRGKGSFVVLGVIPQSAQFNKRDAKRPGGI